MKILLIHRYFWPDTPPYAFILSKIGSYLAAEGHDVDVLSTQPSYKPDVALPEQQKRETFNGMTIFRHKLLSEAKRNPWVKLANIFLFCLLIPLHVIRHGKYDCIMVSTSPPVFGGLATVLAAKMCGARFVYNCT